MEQTIKERLAVLETQMYSFKIQMKGLQKTQWILITVILAQTGITVSPFLL